MSPVATNCPEMVPQSSAGADTPQHSIRMADKIIFFIFKFLSGVDEQTTAGVKDNSPHRRPAQCNQTGCSATTDVLWNLHCPMSQQATDVCDFSAMSVTSRIRLWNSRRSGILLPSAGTLISCLSTIASHHSPGRFQPLSERRDHWRKSSSTMF